MKAARVIFTDAANDVKLDKVLLDVADLAEAIAQAQHQAVPAGATRLTVAICPVVATLSQEKGAADRRPAADVRTDPRAKERAS